jgi:FkbM family methyltransferase
MVWRRGTKWVRNRLTHAGVTLLERPVDRQGMVRLGSAYGGWWVPSDVLTPGAVAYCAGAGEDISFDIALLDRGLRVRTFDPTPRAVVHVASHAPDTPMFSFDAVGWWDSSDEIKFYAPRDSAHVSHSAENLQRTQDFFVAPVEPVHLIKERLGDDRVDLIKMDIEGAEYRVIQSLVTNGPLPSVLCVEFDQPQPTRRTVGAIRELKRHGYQLSHVEAWNFTFTRS